MKSIILCILAVFAGFGSAGQNIKIIDAVPGMRAFLLESSPGTYSYCYTVQTYSDSKTKFRIYTFDSIPRLQSTTELNLFGDYTLLAQKLTTNYNIVVAHSSSQEKLAAFFIDRKTNVVEGPLLLTVPTKKPVFNLMVSETDDLCFVLITAPSKKDNAPLRVVAIAPGPRIRWDVLTQSGGGTVVQASACEDRIVVESFIKSAPSATTVFNQKDGSQDPGAQQNKCTTKKEHHSFAPGKQVLLDSKKIIWVSSVTTEKGSYLIGEEYAVDTAPGAIVGGLVAAMTGVYGASFSTIKFLDVVIQPITSDTTARPAPRYVPMVPRTFTSPGTAISAPGMAYQAVAIGQNRYLGTDKRGMARFLAGNEVHQVSVDTGETSVFGRFEYKGKVPPVIYTARTGLLVKFTDEQTYAVNFFRIQFY